MTGISISKHVVYNIMKYLGLQSTRNHRLGKISNPEMLRDAYNYYAEIFLDNYNESMLKTLNTITTSSTGIIKLFEEEDVEISLDIHRNINTEFNRCIKFVIHKLLNSNVLERKLLNRLKVVYNKLDKIGVILRFNATEFKLITWENEGLGIICNMILEDMYIGLDILDEDLQDYNKGYNKLVEAFIRKVMLDNQYNNAIICKAETKIAREYVNEAVYKYKTGLIPDIIISSANCNHIADVKFNNYILDCNGKIRNSHIYQICSYAYNNTISNGKHTHASLIYVGNKEWSNLDIHGKWDSDFGIEFGIYIIDFTADFNLIIDQIISIYRSIVNHMELQSIEI